MPTPSMKIRRTGERERGRAGEGARGREGDSEEGRGDERMTVSESNSSELSIGQGGLSSEQAGPESCRKYRPTRHAPLLLCNGTARRFRATLWFPLPRLLSRSACLRNAPDSDVCARLRQYSCIPNGSSAASGQPWRTSLRPEKSWSFQKSASLHPLRLDRLALS